MSFNVFGWKYTVSFFGTVPRMKVWAKRKSDGVVKLAFKICDTSRKPGKQQYWEDLDGTERKKGYYSEWVYLKKDGGEF